MPTHLTGHEFILSGIQNRPDGSLVTSDVSSSTAGNSSVDAFLASMNTEPNATTNAIWASSQVADGSGSGTFADPYSLRGAIYNATLGSEVVLKDDGVYQLTNPLNLASDYDDTTYPASFNGGGTGGTSWGGGNSKVVSMNAAKATQESERITVRGEQGTLPIIDCQQMRFCSLESNPYMSFKALKFTNTREVFVVYEGCDYVEFDLISVDMVEGGDNYAPIKVQGGSENGATRHCYFNGPGQGSDGVHLNTAGIYIRNTNNWTFQNITAHNFPLGIYFKHPNDPNDVGGTANVQGLFENIHVYDTDRDGGNSIAANGYTFRNCVLNGALFGATGGSGSNGIAEGGFDNVIENVTFLDRVQFGGDALSTGGSTNPNIDSCVFAERLYGHPWDAGNTFNLTSDNNLFAEDEFRINNQILTYEQYRTQESVDANSALEALTFTGSDASNPDDWSLVGASIDAGCDVTNVGVMGGVN